MSIYIVENKKFVFHELFGQTHTYAYITHMCVWGGYGLYTFVHTYTGLKKKSIHIQTSPHIYKHIHTQVCVCVCAHIHIYTIYVPMCTHI